MKNIIISILILSVSLTLNSAEVKDPNQMLQEGAFYGDEKKVEEALNLGAIIDYQLPDSRNTALMQAARRGRENIVKMLIEKHANLNLTDNKGNTALIHAIFNDFEKIFKMLLEAGANVTIVNISGKSAVDWLSNQMLFPHDISGMRKILEDHMEKQKKTTESKEKPEST